jgi:hypothetical protein
MVGCTANNNYLSIRLVIMALEKLAEENVYHLGNKI